MAAAVAPSPSAAAAAFARCIALMTAKWVRPSRAACTCAAALLAPSSHLPADGGPSPSLSSVAVAAPAAAASALATPMRARASSTVANRPLAATSRASSGCSGSSPVAPSSAMDRSSAATAAGEGPLATIAWLASMISSPRDLVRPPPWLE